MVSFIFYTFKWLYFLNYDLNLIRFYVDFLGFREAPYFCDNLLNTIPRTADSSYVGFLFSKYCSFRSHSTFFRGINTESTFSFSFLVQLILLFSTLTMIFFDVKKNHFRKIPDFFNLALFILGMFFLIYPDFYLGYRLLLIPALLLAHLASERLLTQLVIVKFFIFNYFLFEHFI